MNEIALKARITNWAKVVGKEKAIARLLLTGHFAVSTAEQLCDGRYRPKPGRRLINALEAELRKDGFSFKDAKAS